MKGKWIVRILGLVLIALGAITWRVGFDPVPLSLWRFTTIFPLPIVLAVPGVIVFLAPEFPFRVLAALLPDAKGAKLGAVLDTAFGDPPPALPPGAEPHAVAEKLWIELSRHTKRYYITLGGFFVALLLAAPVLVYLLQGRRDFTRASFALANIDSV